uniref:Nicotinamide-nucleotide amidohydrolase family protein n=1 Tax=candidate division WOR-3 bacterium TaxID=2052148 RepID=A0A7V1EIL7_UNCW3
MNCLAKKLGKLLLKKNLSLSICESCTGGMLGSIITEIPKSSKYFKGGVIAYSNEIKNKIIGVKMKTLKNFGAVSSQTAKEMARNVKKITNSDIGISITGIAGPGGGTKTKPVGLVYIGVATGKKVRVEKNIFSGNRQQIRQKACANALRLTNQILEGEK